MNGFVFFFYIYCYHKKANLKYIYVYIFRDPGNRCCAQATKRVAGQGIDRNLNVTGYKVTVGGHGNCSSLVRSILNTRRTH